jgi:uncharacterized membrane protein
MPSATVIPEPVYPDVQAAVDWLRRTFGFSERWSAGEHRAQLAIGNAALVVMTADGDSRTIAEPVAVTHAVLVRVEDVDAITSTRTHGARILDPRPTFPTANGNTWPRILPVTDGPSARRSPTPLPKRGAGDPAQRSELHFHRLPWRWATAASTASTCPCAPKSAGGQRGGNSSIVAPDGSRPPTSQGDHPHGMMPLWRRRATLLDSQPATRGQLRPAAFQLEEKADMAIGPVQLIVLGFEHPEFHGEIIAELERLRASDTVRVIDALAVHKDADGEFEVVHLSTLSKEEAIELGSVVGALVGLGIEGDEGFVLGAEAGAEAAADGINVFSDEAAWDVLEDIPNDSAAALILLEHHWAVPLRDAIARAGGFRISDGFISPLDLVEIGLVTREEAEELHRLETATP